MQYFWDNIKYTKHAKNRSFLNNSYTFSINPLASLRQTPSDPHLGRDLRVGTTDKE